MLLVETQAHTMVLSEVHERHDLHECLDTLKMGQHIDFHDTLMHIDCIDMDKLIDMESIDIMLQQTIESIDSA
jgi:hypothetical protein